MPPKVKVTKEEIINAAVSLVRENGKGVLNARSVAAKLGCSTQPIFSNFPSMEELDEAVSHSAYELYLSFIDNEIKSGKYPEYKSFGMAYVRFAKEEKELFKLLFMCDRSGKSFTPTYDFEKSVEIIAAANGISKDIARLIHLEMWTCVHGIGTMFATSFLELDWEVVSTVLADVYQGVRSRYVSYEEKK